MYSLTITQSQHAEAKKHLFPGDDKEAAAIFVCRRVGPGQERLVVRRIIPVPYDKCSLRTVDRISWPTDIVEEAIDDATPAGDSLILLHSHPGNCLDFSSIDDESDKEIIPCLYAAISAQSAIHGAAIMVSDGTMRARLYPDFDAPAEAIRVMVVGDSILHYGEDIPQPVVIGTSEMRSLMGHLTACVAGTSGTGSVIVEELTRNGVGRIILVDFDKIEEKNLNRILNSDISHAEAKMQKTDMLKQAIEKFAPSVKVICVNQEHF